MAKKICPECDGDKILDFEMNNKKGVITLSSSPCKKCDGTGEIDDKEAREDE